MSDTAAGSAERGTADAASDAAALRAAADLMARDPRLRGSLVRLPPVGRLLMTGDLHGHEANLRALLRLAELDASPECRLLLHEVIHPEQSDPETGLDLSVRVLVEVARLRVAYPGQVLTVLSNHELAQVNGEPIRKGELAVCEHFEAGARHLYGDGATRVLDAVAAYVRAMPLAVRVEGDGGTVMLSHSLPGPRRIESFDKSILRRRPTDDDLAPGGSANDLVWGRYHNAKILGELAEAWGVDLFVCGHQPADTGSEAYRPNLLVLASDHERGMALPLDLDAMRERVPTLEELDAMCVPLSEG